MAKFSEIMEKIKQWPVHILLFFVFVFLFPIQTRLVEFLPESHIGNNFVFYNTIFLYGTDLLILLLASVWLLGLIRGEFHVKHSTFLKQSKYLLIFSVFAVISVIVSHETNPYIQIFSLFKLFIGILLFCFIINNLAVKHVKQMFSATFWMILLISALEAALGIFQYFAQKSLGLKILGEEFIRPYLNGIAKFKLVEGGRWIFDKIFNVSRETMFLVRPYGTFTHPNVFGAFMGFSSIMTYYLYFVSRETWKRRILGLVLFLQIFAIIISFSRVAILAWILATVFWFVLVLFRESWACFTWNIHIHIKELWQKAGDLDRQGIISLAKIILVSVVVCSVLFFPQFLERGGIVSYGTTNSESLSERLLYQRIAYTMIERHPLTGVGFQNFVLQMDKYSPQPLKPQEHQPVHNIYLLVAAETGLFGLMFFLLFIGSILSLAWKNRSDLLCLTLFGIFVAFLFIGFFDHYLITIQQGRLMFFLVAGLLVVSSFSSATSFVDEKL